MTNYRLYYSPGACSLAAHIALEESGLAYERSRVVVAERQNREPEYLAVNPRGRVPALTIDDEHGRRVLTECMAIMAHVAERAPEKRLLPLSGEAFARALEWMSWLTSSVHQAGARMVIRPGSFTDDEACWEGLRSAARSRVRAYYEDIDQRLTGRDWALGERFSLVDGYLLVFYRWGNKVGMDVRADFPAFTAVMDRVRQRPAVRRVVECEGIDPDKGL